MQFEFDLEKSRLNKIKHGIDFIGVQALWFDNKLVEIPAKTVGALINASTSIEPGESGNESIRIDPGIRTIKKSCM